MLLALGASHAHAQAASRCGQPVSAGTKPVATDCLFILNAAVGLQTCATPCVCAPTGTLPPKASDALLCLASATGQTVPLDCPCPPPCTPSECAAPFNACESEVGEAEQEALDACDATSGGVLGACVERATKVAEAGDDVCDAFEAQCESCCQDGGEGCLLAPEVPKAVGEFEIASRSLLEDIPDLPPGPGGIGYMLLSLGDGDLGFDPLLRTPATAAAECAGAIMSCFAAGERNWAGCLVAVPTCTTATPWEDSEIACCASACVERYQELRRAGLTNPGAVAAAIYEAPSCMPGLDAFTDREVTP